MEITQITVRKRFEKGGLAAVVSVVFDDSLAVHDIKVAYRPDGSYVLIMPKDKRGRDVVHPTNGVFRQDLQSLITKKLEDSSKQHPSFL